MKDARYWATRPYKRIPAAPPPEPPEGDTSPKALRAWRTRARWFEDTAANVRSLQDHRDLRAAVRAGLPALLAGILTSLGVPVAHAELLAEQIDPTRFITDQLDYDLLELTSTARVLANVHHQRKDG